MSYNESYAVDSMDSTNQSLVTTESDQSEIITQTSVDNFTVQFNTLVTTLSSTLNQTTDDLLLSNEDVECSDWQETQHALFQLANLCMAISFLTPSNFRHHAFFLRFMISFGFIFSMLWSGLFYCMLDILIWNVVFFTVNSIHIIYLGYEIIPSRFNKTLEDLYCKTFKPLKVTRKQFKDLSSIVNILLLAKGAVYAKEGHSRCGQKLSMLLKGRLKVTYEGLYLHTVDVNQFIDSLEFDSATQYSVQEKFQVTFTATDDSLLVSWPFEGLLQHLETDTHLQHIFHKLIGKDISQKLYQIQERLLSNPNYMETLGSQTSSLGNPKPGRRSSMVNVRNSIVSSSSSNKLNCFGVDVQGCVIQMEQPSNQSSMGTYETCV